MNVLNFQNIGIWGDSILKGIIFDENKKKYRTLKESAVNVFKQNFSVNINNNSRFGCTAPKAIQNMKAKLEKGYSADAVLIEFGGNDCDYNWLEVSMAPCEAHEPKTPLATFIDTISQMSDMLIKNNIKPVIMNLPPINSQRYFNWISKLKGVNSKNILKWLLHPDAIYRQQERYSLALERIALNKKLHFIDVRSKFLSIRNYIDYLCVDGIHLNANGQQLMGNIFSKYALGV